MKRLNPTAIAFWICGTTTGYLVHGNRGALIGLAITTGVSILWDFIF
jgi:mannitol-specific phosphotransferase system IIBC component